MLFTPPVADYVLVNYFLKLTNPQGLVVNQRCKGYNNLY